MPPTWTQIAEAHQLVYFGYARWPLTNNTCGVPIGYSTRTFQRGKVHASSCPLAAAQGRGGMLRLIGKDFGIAVCAIYFPSTAVGRASGAWRNTVECLFRGLSDTLAALSCRCTPVISTDLNGSFSAQQVDHYQCIGPCTTSRMGFTAKKCCASIHRHRLCIPSKFCKVYPTYYGQKSRISYIGFLATPPGLRTHVIKCLTMTRHAKKLQLAPGFGALLDHARVELELAISLPFACPSKQIAWGRDRVVLALQTPRLRGDVLTELEGRLSSLHHSLPGYFEAPQIEHGHAAFRSAVFLVVAKFFPDAAALI
eukprot:7594416-Pyramimonas_sp.AAC.1